MKEYLPYIVSIITALISFIGSLCVSKKNNKSELEKMKLEHEQTMERNKQEQDARIAQLEREYALKMGTQIVADITDKTLDAVYSSNSVKDAINKQAMKSFSGRQSKGHGKRK